MIQPAGRCEWKGSRGDRWQAYLAPMEAMLAPVDAPLIRALRIDAPGRIADVGCGGGATARRLAAVAPAGSQVFGVDISAALIDEARRVSADVPQLDYELADVAAARSAVPYDWMVSRFGVMFFTEPLAAFANLATWLKPQGRFAFAVWGAPEENPWIYEAYTTVQELVEVSATPPDAPGPFRYSDARAFTTLLGKAGYARIGALTWRGLLSVGGGLDAQEAARFSLGAFQIGQALGNDEALKSRAVHALTERYRRYERDGVVRAQATVNLISGGVSEDLRRQLAARPGG